MALTDGKQRASRCGRGVLKLTSFKPCPRPGSALANGQTQTQSVNNGSRSASNNQPSSAVQNGAPKVVNQGVSKDIRFKNNQTNQNGMPVTVIKNAPARETAPSKDLPKVLAKYTYTANPERPGGFDELGMKQGEKLYFHFQHKSNPHWVFAENMNGVTGYVPASYIMELNEKPTALPWLENKRLEKEAEREKQQSNGNGGNGGFGAPPPGSLPVKKYVSAYVAQGAPASSPQASQYNCEICAKSFNGPQPYKMHMSSKAHKEEVEYQKQL